MNEVDELKEIIKKQQEIISLMIKTNGINITDDVLPCKPKTPTKTITDFDEDAFVSFLTKKGRAKNTIDTYCTAVKLYFRSHKIISNDELSAWQEEIKRLYNPKTVNLKIVAMQKYLDFIGFGGFEFAKVKEQKSTFCDNVINEEQYKKLIEWASENSPQIYKIAKITAGTGVRVSELITLTTADLKKGYVDITNKGKTRRVFFAKSLVNEFLPLCTGEYLIENRYGEPITSRGISSILIKAAEKAGIPKEVMHPHSFRHFFAKQFLKQNNDITLLADILGHSNISTTTIYTRLTSKEQQEKLNNIVNW